MANPDRAGFKPVRSITGLTSWDLSLAEPYLVDDGIFDTEASAIAIGHPVMQTSTENALTGPLGHLRHVCPMTDEHVSGAEALAPGAGDLVAGVVVGISRIGDMTSFNTDTAFGMFMAGPNDLEASSKYITSAEVEADPDGFLVWVAAADQWIFEGQVEAADQEVAKGYTMDVTTATDAAAAIVNTTTGRALVELVQQATDPQAIVTHIPRYIDNDAEAALARVWFQFTPQFTLVTNTGTTAQS